MELMTNGSEQPEGLMPITTESRVSKIKTGVANKFVSARRALEKRLPQNAERIRNHEAYIHTGLEAIIAGDYKKAIGIFSESDAASENAERAGFTLDYRPKIVNVPNNLDEAQTAVWIAGNNSWFKSPDRGGAGVIQTSNIRFNPGGIISLSLDREIYQNIALLNAEEWIHSLQYLKGEIPLGDKEEIGVAKYLLDKGVPLTPRFLELYGRRQALQKMGYKV
jgi:hypothetical protein